MKGLRSGPAPTPKVRGVSRGRLAQSIIAGVVVVVIFVFFLPRVVNYADVWAAIHEMTWLEMVTLAALAVVNQATYWFVEVSAARALAIARP